MSNAITYVIMQLFSYYFLSPNINTEDQNDNIIRKRHIFNSCKINSLLRFKNELIPWKKYCGITGTTRKNVRIIIPRKTFFKIQCLLEILQ